MAPHRSAAHSPSPPAHRCLAPALLLAVMFGLTLALALAAGPLFWRLRFYKTATLLTTLLWLDIALLMFLGVGERCAALRTALCRPAAPARLWDVRARPRCGRRPLQAPGCGLHTRPRSCLHTA